MDEVQPRVGAEVAGASELHEATASLEARSLRDVLVTRVRHWESGSGELRGGERVLDALGHRRTAEGRPGPRSNWGQWAGIGLAAGAAMDSRQDDFADRGSCPVPLGPGIAAAESWLTSGVAQIVIAPVHWPTFLRDFHTAPSPCRLRNSRHRRRRRSLAPHPPDEAPISRLASPCERRRSDGADAGLSSTAVRHGVEDDAGPRGGGPEYRRPGTRLTDGRRGRRSRDARSRAADLSEEFYDRPRIVQLAAYLASEVRDDGASTTGRVEPVRRDEPGRLRAVLWDNARRPATNRSAERLPSVVFVLSSPRSGSTLLRVMLAGHSRLFAPPELHLLQFESMAERRNGLQGSYLEEGLQRAVMAIAGDTADQAKARLDEWCREDIRIEEVYRWLQAHAGARQLVDKSPAYGGSANTLRRAETMFEGARYVHLVRHPSAMIESFVRMRMNQLLGTGAADPTEVAEEMWASSNDNIRQFLAEVDPLRHRLVHYEDLVRRPEQTMKELCALLGLPFEPSVLTPYEGERMTGGV